MSLAEALTCFSHNLEYAYVGLDILFTQSIFLDPGWSSDVAIATVERLDQDRHRVHGTLQL